MWLILFILFDIYFFLWIVIYQTKGILLLLIYWLYWSDKTEKTGTRAWNSMRFLSIWTYVHRWLPLKYQIAFAKSIKSISHVGGGQYLFVLNQCHYILTPLFAFGLAGNKHHNFKDLKLVWCAPNVLFYIPILRDILLWSGAITSDLNTVIQAINSGYSVAYCPHGFSHPGHKSHVENIDDLFEAAQDKKLKLVPVHVEGEKHLYKTFSHPFLIRIQNYFNDWLNYPFPYIIFGFLYTFIPLRQKLTIIIGIPLNDEQDKDLKTEFYGYLNILNKV